VRRFFWDIAPCSLVHVDRRFRFAYCPHEPLKRRSTSARLDGAIYQKVVIYKKQILDVNYGISTLKCFSLYGEACGQYERIILKAQCPDFTKYNCLSWVGRHHGHLDLFYKIFRLIFRKLRMISSIVSYFIYLYLFIVLYNDAFSVTKTTERRMKKWYVNDELERIWKEAVVA
jgi:hypothetical protein